MPRLIVGAVYKKSGETMKTLWTKELRLNTVHVEDVARALWHIALNGKQGHIYNLADKGDTSELLCRCCVALVVKHPDSSDETSPPSHLTLLFSCHI